MANRSLRLGEVLRRELSTLLHARHSAEAALFTITRVRVDDDLGQANVFFLAPDAAQMASCRLLLEKSMGKYRRILARRIALRRFPRLVFHPDNALVAELRVQTLLDELQGQQPAPAVADCSAKGLSHVCG
ncbi:MAG: 30S ribosome-binding factor RbfA [Puniceicoccales bacterium]|jgi:ribosome-binding factor A|nr:30S ribosome-binding factor RbfA [Puniceicoccales bacterium]